MPQRAQQAILSPVGFIDGVWRSPLVPVAVAVSAGILLDRHTPLTLTGGLVFAGIMLIAWTAAAVGRSRGLPLIYLLLATVGIGAVYHHYRRYVQADDDIGRLAGETPEAIQLRGVLDEEPRTRWHPQHDPLYPPRPGASAEATVGVLRVHLYHRSSGWTPASGRVELVIAGPIADLHAGDRVEVVGRIIAAAKPVNPGETDRSAQLRDDGISAIVIIGATPGAIVRLEAGGHGSVAGWLARMHGWGVATLREHLPDRSGLAAALLLGDRSELEAEEWNKYVRTGVVHVLVVSGQHLVLLAIVFGFFLRLATVPRRTATVIVVIFLWGYAFLTGGQAPSVRAAVTYTAFAGGALLRSPVFTANALALAWLFILTLNPTDINGTGCLLSFLSVAGLYWLGTGRGGCEPEPDPLQKLIDESRPAWLRWLRALVGHLGREYLIGAVLWIGLVPLLASRMHRVPLVGLLIGPPVIWLTSIALILGFLLLVTAPVLPLLASGFGKLTSASLGACEWLVDAADRLPFSSFPVGNIPDWWVIGFYALLTLSLLPRTMRPRLRTGILAAASWLCVGAIALLVRWPTNELRITFLAVGHGGCTVLETPDGRVLLYDAGSLKGPGVARYQIAPYLWSRGIHRIDEILLSHADLDHFSGVRDLLDLFSVGQVTTNPSFAEKDNRPVEHILAEINRRGVPIRTVKQGDRLVCSDVTLDVLHPPGDGTPSGVENVRSMVLLVRHESHRILLTGDLEGAGLTEVLRKQNSLPVDVLMAPHHGSRRLDADGLLKCFQPQVVVACDGPPRSVAPARYRGVRYVNTWSHGAITVRSHASGLVVETFFTDERFVVRSGRRDSAKQAD